MNSQNFKKLTAQFVLKTLKVKPGEKVYISYRGNQASKLAQLCAAEIETAKGQAFFFNGSSITFNRELPHLSPEEIEAFGQKRLERAKQVQCSLAIKDEDDESKLTVPDNILKQYNLAMKASIDYLTTKTRWLVVAAPTEEFAKSCGMNSSEFEDFYLNACLIDYSVMTEAVKPLKELMDKTKRVRILSPSQETDLTFNLGYKATACTGTVNLPDGECFTAPVRNSINGTIKFVLTQLDGKKFPFIKLTFENGRIVKAESDNEKNTKALNVILDTDDGARYIGEFAINFNPHIHNPTGSPLFDEKINGGLHLAVGDCYEEADNGNKSAIHWDLIHIQRPDYGGGEIWFDGKLIRKDGLFVVPELLPLNPEKLIGAIPSRNPAFAATSEKTIATLVP